MPHNSCELKSLGYRWYDDPNDLDTADGRIEFSQTGWMNDIELIFSMICVQRTHASWSLMMHRSMMLVVFSVFSDSFLNDIKFQFMLTG